MIIIPSQPQDFPALRGRLDERLRCTVCRVPLSWERLGYGVCAGLFCETCFQRGFYLNYRRGDALPRRSLSAANDN